MQNTKVARIFLSPPVLGALFMLVLSLRAATVADDGDLGGAAEAVAKFIEHRFGDEIHRIGIAIAATAIAVGALLGVFALLLVIARRRKVPDTFALAGEGFLVTIVLYAFLQGWGMATSPQLYAAKWYARGGALRLAQVVATDVFGPKGIIVAVIVFIAAYTWRSILHAARSLSKRSTLVASSVVLLLSVAGLLVLVGDGVGGRSSLESSAHAQEAASRPNASERPNIVVIAADSFRADRLDPRVAPHLSAVAQRGTRFDRAYVSMPRTFPSWVTILTGRHAHRHGIRSMFPRWEDRQKDFDALPERLHKAGYKTAVVSDYAGDIFSRIDLGFERIDAPSFDFRQLIRQRALERETPLLPILHSHFGRSIFPVLRELNHAADPNLLADDSIRAIRSLKGAPFFLTIFFSTAHFPYAAPAPYYREFTKSDYRGRFKYHKPVGIGDDEAAPDAADVEQIRALYDGAVRSIDDAATRVLDEIESLGLSKNTIIVLTADHGETLYDNNHGQGHGDHLFGDEGTHVPLVILDPRQSGKNRVNRIVRDVDLAPTLYALANVPPPSDLDGHSLAPALSGGDVEKAFAVAETELWFTQKINGLPDEWRLPYPGILELTELDSKHGEEIVLQKAIRPVTLVARHRMIRDERWKLIYIPARRGVKYMLFDTENDPGETKDVSGSNPDQVERLRSLLWAYMLKDPQMESRNGYLVPRAGGGLNAP